MRRLGILIIVMGATLWPAAALAATSAPVLLQSVSNSTTLQGTVSLAVSGNDAYTTAYWPGELTAVDISNPNAPTVVGSTPPDARAREWLQRHDLGHRRVRGEQEPEFEHVEQRRRERQ